MIHEIYDKIFRNACILIMKNNSRRNAKQKSHDNDSYSSLKLDIDNDIKKTTELWSHPFIHVPVWS